MKENTVCLYFCDHMHPVCLYRVAIHFHTTCARQKNFVDIVPKLLFRLDSVFMTNKSSQVGITVVVLCENVTDIILGVKIV